MSRKRAKRSNRDKGLRALEKGLTANYQSQKNEITGNYPVTDEQLLNLNSDLRLLFNNLIGYAQATSIRMSTEFSDIEERIRNNPNLLLLLQAQERNLRLQRDLIHHQNHLRTLDIFSQPFSSIQRFDEHTVHLKPPLPGKFALAFQLIDRFLDPLYFTSRSKQFLYRQLSRLIGMRIFIQISTLMKRMKKMKFCQRSDKQ